MKLPLPRSWQAHVGAELQQPYFQELREFVAAERRRATVYPPEDEVFTALRLTPYEKVKVMILGQDPYHGPGQAHGLAFSLRPGVRPPPSLANIFKELKAEMGCPVPKNGSLEERRSMNDIGGGLPACADVPRDGAGPSHTQRCGAKAARPRAAHRMLRHRP